MMGRNLRRRCQEVVAQLDIPSPLDVRALCADVAAGRGRPILLIPMDGGQGPSGLWMATPTTDYLAFTTATSALHQDHIILHELGHLLCGHASVALAGEAHRSLLPSLDATTVGRVLGRTSYGADQEREAELVASLIHQHAQRRPAHRSQEQTGAALAVRRIERVLKGTACFDGRSTRVEKGFYHLN